MNEPMAILSSQEFVVVDRAPRRTHFLRAPRMHLSRPCPLCSFLFDKIVKVQLAPQTMPSHPFAGRKCHAPSKKGSWMFVVPKITLQRLSRALGESASPLTPSLHSSAMFPELSRLRPLF